MSKALAGWYGARRPTVHVLAITILVQKRIIIQPEIEAWRLTHAEGLPIARAPDIGLCSGRIH